MEPITIFNGSTGLNIVDAPTRIGQTEGGFVDLQAAINVSIDQSGRVQSRAGVNQLHEGYFHSLFSYDNICLVLQDGILYQVALDGSLTNIKTNLSNERMAFLGVGDRVYYTNGFDLGIIYQGQYVEWLAEDYVGPGTHRHLSGPFSGNHLNEFFGKLLISKDNALYWSEPYNFGLFDLATSFIQFHTKIIMLATVDSGLYLSTEKNTYFLSGRDPLQWQAKKIFAYPAIEWTNTFVEAADIGAELPGQYAVWTSREGVVLGSPDGNITNVNKRKIIYPENTKTGFGGLIGTNYIHGME